MKVRAMLNRRARGLLGDRQRLGPKLVRMARTFDALAQLAEAVAISVHPGILKPDTARTCDACAATGACRHCNGTGYVGEAHEGPPHHDA